jgi:hypothetical protein
LLLLLLFVGVPFGVSFLLWRNACTRTVLSEKMLPDSSVQIIEESILCEGNTKPAISVSLKDASEQLEIMLFAGTAAPTYTFPTPSPLPVLRADLPEGAELVKRRETALGWNIEITPLPTPHGKLAF